MQTGADINDINSDGDTALHVAVEFCRGDILIKPLIDSGANLEWTNHRCDTVLLPILDWPNLNNPEFMSIVKSLLINGANFNAIDMNGNSPLILVGNMTKEDTEDVRRTLYLYS